MTKKKRLLAAIRHEPVDFVPVAPAVWQWMRRKYGVCHWLFELEMGRQCDFDPMPHLSWFDGPPFHNNIRILNGSYRAEGRAYGEDLPPGVAVDVHIERHQDYSLIRRTIQTPAGNLSDAIQQPLPKFEFKSKTVGQRDPSDAKRSRLAHGTVSGRSLKTHSNGENDGARAPGWRFPQHLERLLKEPRDLEKIQFLLTEPTMGELQLIRCYIDVVGENGLLAADCLSPLDYLANQAVSNEDLLDLYRTNRPFFDAIVQLFSGHAHQRLKAYLDAGLEMVNAVWYGCGPSAGWETGVWKEVFLPLLKRDIEVTHDHRAIFQYNDHGRIADILPMLSDAGVDVVETMCPPPRGDADLSLIKRLYGRRLCLRGWIDAIEVLEKGTPQTIEDAVREAMEIAAPGSGFIIGTSQPITVNTPEKNLQAYFRACRKYGETRRSSPRRTKAGESVESNQITQLRP